MSLITRCPACQTLFRVVPDQLRISEGWVRCGQCDEIFDASLHLLQGAPQDPPPVARSPAPAVNLEASDRPELTAQPLDINLDSDCEVDRTHDTAKLPLTPEPAVWPAEEDVCAPEHLSGEPSDDGSVVPLTPAPPGPAAEFTGPESELGGDERDAFFLRDKKVASLPRQPLLRAILALLCLLLLLLLAGQIVWHQRDRLAASQPSFKPGLLTLCGVFNCILSPLRRIDALVIESSSFVRLEGDAYRLNFTLKNTAASALAVPALELTLTDALDQPVLRRVLLADQLGAASDTLAAGAEWPVSVALAVKTEGTAEPVAGYRLLVFYP